MQNLRLQKVDAYIKLIQDLSLVLSVDFYKMISGVHPSFGDSSNNLTESISNDTLARLAGIVHSLEQEKLQRLQKVWLRAILLLHVMYAKFLSEGYQYFFLNLDS